MFALHELKKLVLTLIGNYIYCLLATVLFMALKDIYTNAIQKVIDGTLKKEELWEVFEDHLRIEKDRNEELVQKCAEYEKRYKHLLEQVNSAHKEHEKIFGR